MQNFNIIPCQPYSEEWYAARKDGIGGSDAPKAIGLSKWGTPYTLYLEKIGEGLQVDETWEMMRGKGLEPALRQNYANVTGSSVMLPPGILQSNQFPFMFYNPDGISGDRLVELKTAQYGAEWGDQESDDIPHDYVIQVQHGLIVTGLNVCDVHVSIGGNKPKQFVVEADAELQQMIIEGERAFWEKVVTRTEPDPISNEDALRRYRFAQPVSIVATGDIETHYASLKQLRADLKTMEASKEAIEVVIKSFMAENDTLINENGGTLCTWKARKGAERVDTKALKADEPDVYERFIKVGEATRTFLVK